MTWRGSMPDQSFVPLPGSERAELPGAVAAGAVNGAERIEVTLILRRRQPLPETGGVPARLGLQVTASDTGSRRITVAGPVSALAETFGAELSLVSSVAPPGPGAAGPAGPGRPHRPGRPAGVPPLPQRRPPGPC